MAEQSICDDVEKRVIEFIAAQSATSISRISPATTLFGDLGIDGDDAGDLLEAFVATFHVDLSQFEFTEHFGTEGLGCSFPVFWFLAIFGSGSPEQRVGLKAISISDLVQAARSGRWEEHPAPLRGD